MKTMAKFTELGRGSGLGFKHWPSDSDPEWLRQEMGWVGAADKELSGEEEARAKKTCTDVGSLEQARLGFSLDPSDVYSGAGRPRLEGASSYCLRLCTVLHLLPRV